MTKFKSSWILGAIVFIFIFLPLIFPLGVRVANDFPYITPDFLKSNLSLPSTWTYRSAEGLGEYAVPTLWSWPFQIINGVLANVGLNYSVILYLTLIFPIFILGVYSINKFLKHFGVSKAGRVVGGLLYLGNTYFLLLIDGGQLSIALEYALFPLVFVLITDSINKGFRNKLVAALAVVAMGVLDPRAIFLMALLVGGYVFYLLVHRRKRGELIKNSFTTLLVILFTYVGLNFYWILPSLLSKASFVPPGYVVATQSFATLRDAITLHQPQWYLNVFGKTGRASIAFFAIPIFVFGAVFLVNKNKKILFWTIVATFSIFMAKGVSPPLGGIYSWLFNNIPGFFVFRDSTKFFFLVALSYSLLLGYTMSTLSAKAGWVLIGKKKISIPVVLFTAYLVFLIRPIYLGRMTGMFSVQPMEKSFFELQKLLDSDDQFGRILWLPGRVSLSYATTSHPALEGLRLLRERPVEVGVVGTYDLFNFLRESTYMGQIMKVLGVKYIAYPEADERRVELKPEDRDYYQVFLEQISGLPWIDKKVFGDPYNVYQTKETKDRFFVAGNTYYVVGSDSLYAELQNIPKFDLAQNALLFAEESPELLKKIINGAKIIVFDKNNLDLTAALLPREDFIFPANDLPASPAAAGWWSRKTPDFLWLRDFLQQKYGLDNSDFDYGGGYAIAEGNRNLQFTNSNLQKGNKLLARIMVSGHGGKVEFWQGDSKIGEVNTLYEDPDKVGITITGYGSTPDQNFEYNKADFLWFSVGNLADDSQITIKTEGDINVINSLGVITPGDWKSVEQKVDGLRREGKIIVWNKLDGIEKQRFVESSGDPKITYKEISPTHYKVNVENLGGASTLLFSEAYNSMWTLNGQGSTKVYSLINGFGMQENGEYDIYFTPQKYVLPGLLVSASVLVLILLYNFHSVKKGESK